MITLGKNVPFDRDTLRVAVKGAVDHARTSEIATLRGDRVRVGPSAVNSVPAIQGEGFDFQFPAFRLLSENPTTRAQSLEEELAEIWLPENEVSSWRSRAATAMDFDDVSEFMADIGATPERFARNLREGRDNLGMATLCPASRRLYERTVGSPVGADNDSVDAALVGIRGARLRSGSSSAVSMVLHSCGRHDLVPVAECRLQREKLIGFLEDTGEALAPWQALGALHLAFEFGLSTAAEVCASRFRDAKWIDGCCHLTAAGFVLTALQFNTVKDLKQAPAQWRRLACFTHASVIASSLLDTDVNAEEFWRWVQGTNFANYTTALIYERRDLPRWHHAWILPSQLRAELVGRLQLLAVAYPESARNVRLESIAESLVDQGDRLFMLSSALPGPLEGDRSPPGEPRSVPNQLEENLIATLEHPTVPHCAGLLAASLILPPSERVWNAVVRYLANVSVSAVADSEGNIAGQFVELAYVVGIGRRIDVAHQLSELLLKAHVQGALTNSAGVGHMLLELAIAMPAGATWFDHLAKAFERLAFGVRKQADARALLDIVDTLGCIDSALIERLARARMVIALFSMSGAAQK